MASSRLTIKISDYNSRAEDKGGIKGLFRFVQKRILLQGFLVSDEDIGPAHSKEHQANLQKWLHDGSFKAKLSVTEGIDHAAEGFVGMLTGKNFGKTVVKIKE